ncbi:MAG: hypothetical protein QOH58_970 [Thermoleophilaceae bacterium]|jgi:hypothetical protein|nr:hypothetical protein [Thermoleophilaceae bacterium]
MSRLRRAALGTSAALLAVCAVSVPSAAAADAIVPFTNYQVGGSLTVAKLHQEIHLPSGSTFNGAANLTTGQLSGNVFIPEFTSTVRVLGIPTRVTTKLEQAQPVQGTVALDPTDGSLSIRSSTSAILRITRMRLGLLSVPTTCRTAEPIVLALNYDGPLATSFTFDGVTTIPRLTGCGLLGPTLGALMSGPGNAYHLTLEPPAAG